ncbi:MAG: hypothetical protein B6U73_04930 [Desulfurococcales archaeon ex4484_204]|nr:MAG: hypothetical protein B6U73_04930 [Desulfurococcales archaeon ex4484_204]
MSRSSFKGYYRARTLSVTIMEGIRLYSSLLTFLGGMLYVASVAILNVWARPAVISNSVLYSFLTNLGVLSHLMGIISGALIVASSVLMLVSKRVSSVRRWALFALASAVIALPLTLGGMVAGLPLVAYGTTPIIFWKGNRLAVAF